MEPSPGSNSASPTSASPARGAAALRRAQHEFDFNLQQAKAHTLKALDERANQVFKRFFSSTLFERLLNTALLYFTAKFMHDWLVQSMEKARKTHLEGYDPVVVACRLGELEEEMAQRRMELSPTYSEIVLKYAKYEKPQHDKQFFETLILSLSLLAEAAFARLDRKADIESEIGLLFRSKHFNMNHRRYVPPRSIDTLSVKELYAIKHETTNRALNAKMLSGLNQKPQTLAVQLASLSNSPLISQFVTSPMVARAQAKDPQERDKLISQARRSSSSPSGRTGGHGSSSTGMRSNPGITSAAAAAPAPPSLRTVFRTGAALHGVDVSHLRENIASGKLSTSEETKLAVGLMSEERTRRSEVHRVHGVLAPESLGVPADDAFNYMALLKRYVLFGPSLGFASQGGGPHSPSATNPGTGAAPLQTRHRSFSGAAAAAGTE